MLFAVTGEEKTLCPHILRMSMWSQFSMELNSIEPSRYAMRMFRLYVMSSIPVSLGLITGRMG